jgi:hypothetical protein
MQHTFMPPSFAAAVALADSRPTITTSFSALAHAERLWPVPLLL